MVPPRKATIYVVLCRPGSCLWALHDSQVYVDLHSTSAVYSRIDPSLLMWPINKVIPYQVGPVLALVHHLVPGL
jgi:hypothetical protein